MQSPRPARSYGLVMILCLLPMVAVVIYAFVSDLQQRRLQQETERNRSVQFVVSLAGQALLEAVQQQRERLAESIPAAAIWQQQDRLWQRAEVSGVLVLQAGQPQSLAALIAPYTLPAQRPRPQAKGKLLAAQEYELIHGQAAKAVPLYRVVFAQAKDPAQRAMALAGLVACLARSGSHEEALRRLDPRQAGQALLPWEEVFALYLLIDDQVRAGALGQQLARDLYVAARIGQLPERQVAALRQCVVDAAGLTRIDAYLERGAADRNLRQHWQDLSASQQTHLSAGQLIQVSSGLWIPVQRDDAVFVVQTARAPLLTAARLVLQQRIAALPVVAQLRDDRQIMEPDTVAVLAPWGEALALHIDSSRLEAEQSPWASWLLAASALSAVLIGFAVLWWMMRRDLQLIRLRQDFIASITHELKTPLALIRMFAESLQLGYQRDEAARQHGYRIIIDESDRLALLVENVLSVSRQESGMTRELAQDVIDPIAIMELVKDLYSQRLTEQKFTQQWAIADDLPLIAGDADALQQVLRNLLDNAIKYSQEEKFVAVAVVAEEHGVQIAVRDRGIGIPESERAKVFERYHRGAAAIEHDRSGLGLGLSLCRDIVEAHGGRIELAESSDPGSVFTVFLPGLDAESHRSPKGLS